MYIHQLAGNRADAMVPGPVPRLAPPPFRAYTDMQGAASQEDNHNTQCLLPPLHADCSPADACKWPAAAAAVRQQRLTATTGGRTLWCTGIPFAPTNRH